MSSDWISMEKSLWSHPKIVRIMSACKADRCPVLGALFRLWSIADTHTDDGFLFGYTPQLLDDEVKIPGFSESVRDVGWLYIHKDGLQVPDFKEHMSKSAKRRAMDAKRKKNVRTKSAKKRTKSGPHNSTLHISIPDGIDKDSWQRFFDYRQAMPKRNRLTEEACKLAFALLLKHPPEAQKQIIDKTIMAGWTGLFEPKGGNDGQANHPPKLNAFDRTKQRLAEWERQQGGNVIDGEAVGAND